MDSSWFLSLLFCFICYVIANYLHKNKMYFINICQHNIFKMVFFKNNMNTLCSCLKHKTHLNATYFNKTMYMYSNTE